MRNRGHPWRWKYSGKPDGPGENVEGGLASGERETGEPTGTGDVLDGGFAPGERETGDTPGAGHFGFGATGGLAPEPGCNLGDAAGADSPLFKCRTTTINFCPCLHRSSFPLMK
ncbi:hypothetical protein SLA2020_043000 [Shorea laevis]